MTTYFLFTIFEALLQQKLFKNPKNYYYEKNLL